MKKISFVHVTGCHSRRVQYGTEAILGRQGISEYVFAHEDSNRWKERR